MLTDEALRDRLRALATAAGLPVPPVEEDTEERSVPHVRGGAGQERIVVPPALFEAPPATQTWYLAGCLGWWTSPTPRLRRRVFRAVVIVTLAVYLGAGGALLLDLYDMPRVAMVGVHTAMGTLSPLIHAAASRWQRRGVDAAGLQVLRAAGHDPAALTRQVFGAEPEPSWFRRLLSPEPTPSERLAAAESRGTEPARPLF